MKGKIYLKISEEMCFKMLELESEVVFWRCVIPITQHAPFSWKSLLSWREGDDNSNADGFPRSSDSGWIIVRWSWLNSFSVLSGCPSRWYDLGTTNADGIRLTFLATNWRQNKTDTKRTPDSLFSNICINNFYRNIERFCSHFGRNIQLLIPTRN